MEETRKELLNKLEQIAYQKTTAFCYLCYKQAPKGECSQCGSDDLMRELKGVGVEYGTDWVITSILEEELSSIDIEKFFENAIAEIYPEQTQVAWLNLDTVTILKEQDPISWNAAQQEYIESLVKEEELISLDDNTYYHKHDIEEFINKQDVA